MTTTFDETCSCGSTFRTSNPGGFGAGNAGEGRRAVREWRKGHKHSAGGPTLVEILATLKSLRRSNAVDAERFKELDLVDARACRVRVQILDSIIDQIETRL